MKESFIKFCLLTLGLLCLVSNTNAQVTVTYNYVKSTEYLTQNGEAGEKKSEVVYYNNINLPVQAISTGATPNEKDIVVKINYEDYLRPLEKFLPAPTDQSNGTHISQDALQSLYSGYYQSNYNEPEFFYSEVELEAPPLGRVLKKAAPGDDWRMGSGHEVNYKYEIATSADAVVNFKANTTLSGDVYNITLQKIGNYGTGLIHKTTVTDENGSKTEQFVNRKGQTVLIRKYSTTGTGTTLVKHDTYYVYDSYGNLAYMLPPQLSAITSITQALLDNLGYQYKYDVRNRLVEKKLPGKGWEYIVYDKLDRPVLTKDAVNPWQFVKYDDFNRVVYSGIYNGSESRTSLQATLNTQTVINESRTGTAATQDGISLYYTKNAFPTTNFSLLTVDYYDSYDNILVTGVTLPSTVETQTVLTANNNLNGVPVASFIRILESTDWEKVYTFYDNKLQPVRTHKINHLGGYTIADSKLDFRGKPELTRTYHKRTTSATEVISRDNYSYDHQERLLAVTNQINAGNEERIVENSYDQLGMPVSKNVGNRTTLPALQKVDYSYNIRGWMTGINDIQNLVETGFPTDLFAFGIQYNTIDADVDADLGLSRLYNGNITQTKWRTASDNILRGYAYEYDKLNRLKKAHYYKPGATNPFPQSFDEQLVYNLNGNITSLQRRSSPNDLSSMLTDNLTYTYTANTNRLLRVTDSTNSDTGFDNGNSGTSNDYTYDANGNMLTDKNKEITNITYNHLSQPTAVTWSSSKKIQFAYNAAGQKVKKVVTDGSIVKTTDYLDGFQYTNANPEFFPTAEGYVKVTVLGTPTNAIWMFNYVYNHVDHLGNIRLSYTKDPQTGNLKILDENHYYPFGLQHNKTSALSIVTPNFVDVIVAPTSNQPFDYRFQSQELQEEHGLNWYAYRYRNYDPAIGRFFNVDPLTEQYHEWGAYVFSGNRVVDSFELEGLEPKQAGKFEGEVREADGFDWFWSGESQEWGVSLEGASLTGQARSGRVESVHMPYRDNIVVPNDVDLGVVGSLINMHNGFKNGQQDFVVNTVNSAIDLYNDGGKKEYWEDLAMETAMSAYNSPMLNSDPMKDYEIFNSIYNASAYDWGYFGGYQGSAFVASYAVTGGLGGMAGGLGRVSITTSDGFLFGGINVRTPFNIPVQRFGNMNFGKPDFWGLRIGTSKFANRTFVAMHPKFGNPLTQYTTGIIPQGTPIKLGIVGPQGWRYPGGSFQFIVPSKNVVEQSTKIIAR